MSANSQKKIRAKVKTFQREVGLPVTGHYDPETRQEIRRAKAGKPSETPKAKKARREARLNDPNLVTAPLTPKTLQSERDAAVRQKYGQAETGLNDQIRVSDFQSNRRIPDYYADYLRAIQQAQYGAAGANQQVAQQIQGQIQGDTASSDSPEAQQALQARRALLQTQADSTARQFETNQSYYGGLQANSKLGLAQSAERERARKDNLLAQLRQLQQDKGDYGVTIERDARTAERNNQLQNATLGLNTQKAETDAQNNKIKAKIDSKAKAQAAAIAKARLELEAERIKDARKRDKFQREHGLGPYKPAAPPKNPSKKGQKGGPTHTQKVKAANQYQRALGVVKGIKSHDRTFVYSYLQDQYQISADIARAVTEIHFDGGVNTAVFNTLYRRYRIKPPRLSSPTNPYANGTKQG